MSQAKMVAQNALWLTLATTGQKVISFLTFTLVARLVGVHITGSYFYAVSVTSAFGIIADLGLTPVIIREMAANVVHGQALLGRALKIKSVLIPLAALAALAYVWSTQAERETIVAVAIACFVMSADNLSLVWYGALRSTQKLRFEAWGMFLGQIITAIVTLVSVFFFHGVSGLIFGLFCGSAWNVFWSIHKSRKQGISFTTDGNWPALKLLRFALPFALAGIFVRVYSYVDTLLLKQFHDAIAVGYYAIAYKVTYSFQFLPLTFVAALYPSMSAVHAANDRDGMNRLFIGSLRLMMVLAIPLAAGLSAFAPRLVPLVYGQAYLGSVAPLIILPWVLIPLFLDFPIGSLLNATHRAGQKTIAMGVTMVLNVVMNFLLVPSLGPVGAAWAAVVSFSWLFLIGAWFVRKDVARISWFLWFVIRGLIVAALLWLIIHYVFSFMPLIIALMSTGILTILLLTIVKLLRQEDFTLLKNWLRRRYA
ncbi:flippase [Candidatus Uhrbacteria bacterium]|nr:flippase [Candidatus Uhrbacteria bacterium]